MSRQGSRGGIHHQSWLSGLQAERMSLGPDPARASSGAERAAAVERSVGQGGCLHNSLWQKRGGVNVGSAWSGLEKESARVWYQAKPYRRPTRLANGRIKPAHTYSGCPHALFFRQEGVVSSPAAPGSQEVVRSARACGPSPAGASGGRAEPVAAAEPAGRAAARCPAAAGPRGPSKLPPPALPVQAREFRRALELYKEAKRRADRQLKVQMYKLKRSYTYFIDGPVCISHTSVQQFQ